MHEILFATRAPTVIAGLRWPFLVSVFRGFARFFGFFSFPVGFLLLLRFLSLPQLAFLSPSFALKEK